MKVVTIAVWLVYVAVLLFSDLSGYNYVKEAVVIGILSVALFGILILSPRRISLDDNGVTVHRVIGKKKISYKDISETGLSYTPLFLRVCGSGGFCGYIGWFKSLGFGTFFSYVGNKDQAFYVVLKNGRRYMLSCEDPDDAIANIRSKISQ